MHRLCIAGGIGAGKSTVLEILRERGIECWDADQIYRDLTVAGSPLWHAILDAFGSASINDEQNIDRAYLGAIVFRDPSALRRLNAITHPAIGREISRRFEKAHGSVAAVAIPLLRPEHRSELRLDEIWHVSVEPAVARERLMATRGLTKEEADQRIAAQSSNAERSELADIEITNNGALAALHSSVLALLDERGW